MSTLNGCRKLLNIANLCNLNGFKIGQIHVSNELVDFVVVSPVIVMGIFSTILIIENRSYGLMGISSSISILIGCLSVGLIYICLAFKTRDIIQMINFLEDLVEQRSKISLKLKTIYHNQKVKNESLMKFIWWYAITVQINVTVLPALLPISYVMFGVPTPDSWNLPFPISPTVPFDMSNPAVYYVALLMPISAGFTYMSIFSAFTALYITVCTYIATFVDDMLITVSDLNEQLKSADETNGILKDRKLLLTNFLEFNFNCFELMKRFRLIMSGPLFFQLLIFVIFVALYLLQFDEIATGDLSNVVFNLSCLSTQMIFNYVSCHFATNATFHSFAIGDISYQLLWYHLPVSEQKLIAFNIKRAHIPYALKGYNFLMCSLHSYLNLLKSALSYYMVFRTV